jgi:hypothetical protein
MEVPARRNPVEPISQWREIIVMMHHDHTRALRRGIAILLVAGACGRDSGQTGQQAGGASSAGEAASPPSSAAAGSDAASSSNTPAELSSADLDAYARGIAKEIELVRAAQTKASSAATPQERGAAMQEQWEDQTIPEGARSAGLAPDRYRHVRQTVHHVFQTLDFQGKIDGPMQMDTAHATPEMKQQLASDPMNALSPASRTALRAKMDQLVPTWVQYVKLTALAG